MKTTSRNSSANHPHSKWARVALAVLPLSLALLGQFVVPSAKAASLVADTSFRAPLFAKALTGRSLLLPDGKFLLLSGPNTLTDQRTGAITRHLPDGSLDTTFNFSRLYKSVSTATPAPDGKLYIAATKYLYGKKEAEEILRLNSDGSIDASFNKTVLTSEIGATVQQIRLQPDGKILVAGFIAAASGAGDGIFRLLPDGTMDPTFSSVTIDGFLLTLALQPDGKVLIAGEFGNVNGVTNQGVVRLNADGSLDSSFQATGFTRSNAIRGMVVQSDGKIVLSGHFRFGTVGSAPRAPLVRLGDTGSVDSTFNSISTVTGTPTGRELLIQPDGKLVAAVNGSVCRFNTDGSRDSSFYSPYFVNAMPDPTRNPTTESGTALSVNRYPDGRILVGGIFTDVDPPGAPGNAYQGVARLNANGTLDSSLISSHKTGVETAPGSFARLADGSTLIGFADKIDPPITYNVGRLLSDGSLDSSFTLSSSDPDSFLSDGFRARGFARLADDNFFVFGLQAATGAFAYGKVAPNGVHDTAFAREPIYPFQEAIAAPDGKVLLCAGTDARATVYSPLTRLLADGHYDSLPGTGPIHDAQVERLPDFNIIWRMYVGSRVLAIQPDGKILFVYLGSDQLFHFLRLEDGGSFAGATFPTPDLSENFPYVFDYQTGTTYQPPEGVWTASFPLRDAHIQADGRIILVGQFTSYKGTAARGIVRLEPNGAVDNSFNAGGGAQWTETVETSTSFPAIEQIEVQDDGKLLIAGTFEAFNGVAAPGIALLNPDGSVDTSFVAPALRDKRSRVASGLKRQSDGSFLLSGPYTFRNETLSPSFIRLIYGTPTPVPSPTPTPVPSPTPTPTPTPSATPTPTPTPIIGSVGNVSTRLPVGVGENVLIEGFIVQGPAGSSKKIIVRALGPSLSQFGIVDAVENPTLEIRDSSNAVVATNNDWKTTQIGGLITGDQSAEITASQLAPTNDRESAIIAHLTPGSYTAIVRGAGDTIGSGLVDAFDLSHSSSARLANVATRGLIQPGDKLMIGGFIVQNGPINVVVRAIGPSLTMFGISNALPDTTLQLRDQNGAIVLENDNWKSHQREELEAIGLEPSHDLEAALITTIQPGQYTAQVRGKDQASGIGVVEVYFPQ